MVKDLMFPGLDEFNYNPMNDAIFKFIFGKEERKQITIDFLNAVLEKSLGHPIQDLIFSGTEMNPENAMDKLTRLDVACILDSGEQVINERNMERRTLFYWAQMYLMSLPAGKTYDQLKPAITVNLLDFIFFSTEKSPCHV
ncbi:Rpn family recombination-promoting nuclease/putative transposase [Dialister sp.]|uniref:Rpn family recombination-promoting nuclease/putative transposase n=1 Tax=Dialister sp. TaxID=1955814 RepID=UPI003A5C0C1C